ncbi:MAG: glutamate--tRNA ligase family protein [bacterium]|nr:glutamate--tRNA ligase family protein [bacterium]
MSYVVTRFAPSPTGLKHAGNYRTAVFCYLFAKHSNGSSLVRIEDTDKARSKPEHEQNIFDTLTWLDLMPTETPTRSSDRMERHKELLQKLVAEDKAFLSHEPKKDDPTVMIDVVRLRNPKTNLTFHDEIRGDITFDTTELGDFVIARAIDDPLYHFAVVVDDGDMGVTHVIRGEDHISNTPRHILIQQALDLPHPIYAHVPLLLNTNRTKLSTRTGAKPLYEYRDMGVLPEAMLNYLALLGWNPGDDREYLSREELIEAFDLSRVQKGSAVFDEVKLLSVNQHWMRALSDSDFLTHLNTRSDLGKLALRSDLVLKAVALLKERAHTFGEASEMLAGELFCLFTKPSLDRKRLLAKEPPEGRPLIAKNALKTLSEAIKALPEGISAEEVKNAIMPLADAEEAKEKGGRGAILWPLRYALSGQDRSPDPFTLISILGIKETISRIDGAVAILER